MNIPNTYQPLFAKEAIQESILKKSELISSWMQRELEATGQDPIVVPILRGALFFASDLLKAISVSCEIRPVHVKSYQKNKKSSEPIFESIEWCHKRTLLLVDDICETGDTLASLTQDMIKSGAREVKSIVLVKRGASGKFTPDWFCFEYPGTEWLVGYGMDDNERFRNLPDVYRMAPK